MQATDADRMRLPNGREVFCCARCKAAPTCPMLHDDVWQTAWDGSGATARTCETRDGRQRPLELLCLECAEHALGRLLTLDDLFPCVGNYAAFRLAARAVEGL